MTLKVRTDQVGASPVSVLPTPMATMRTGVGRERALSTAATPSPGAPRHAGDALDPRTASSHATTSHSREGSPPSVVGQATARRVQSLLKPWRFLGTSSAASRAGAATPPKWALGRLSCRPQAALARTPTSTAVGTDPGACATGTVTGAPEAGQRTRGPVQLAPTNVVIRPALQPAPLPPAPTSSVREVGVSLGMEVKASSPRAGEQEARRAAPARATSELDSTRSSSLLVHTATTGGEAHRGQAPEGFCHWGPHIEVPSPLASPEKVASTAACTEEVAAPPATPLAPARPAPPPTPGAPPAAAPPTSTGMTPPPPLAGTAEADAGGRVGVPPALAKAPPQVGGERDGDRVGKGNPGAGASGWQGGTTTSVH